MQKMNIKTIYRSSNVQFESIMEYLKTEQITGNLMSVKSSFKRKELIILFKEKELIGFSAYQFEYPVSRITVFEIVKKFRGKGLGKKLVNKTLKEIKKKKGEVVELFCSPVDSESFWKKVGFKNLPETRFTNGKIIMYKTLIETLLPNQSDDFEIDDNQEIIELWDVEPFQADRNKPKWRWRINSYEFKKPIIQPTDSNWQIRWRKGGIEIKKGKVKYFSSNQIEFGNFMILRDLIDIKKIRTIK